MKGNAKVWGGRGCSLIKAAVSFALSLALAFSAPAADGFNDNIDRNDPNFVKVSLLIMGPGEELFSCAGHACLRLECPTFNLDYCFSYESESVRDKVWTFFKGDLKMGMFAVPTKDFLKEYETSGRGVTQYALNLPPDAKQRLWKHMDELAKKGADLPYDYIKRGCAWSVLNCLRASLPPYQLDYPAWPEKYKQSRREIIESGISIFPWTTFFIHTFVGTAGDRTETNLEKVVMPLDLRDFLASCRVGGVPVLDAHGQEVLPRQKEIRGARWVTPLTVALLILVCSGVNFLVKKPCLDWLFLGLQSSFGLFLTYLVAFSSLPATDWNWLLVPFNLLPLIFWKWRKTWVLPYAAILVVWELAMLCAPHRLIDPAYYVLVLAYIIFYLKFSPRILARMKGVRQ